MLVTGGTGSFGRRFVKLLLDGYPLKKLIVLSRDELKQHEMRQQGLEHPRLRYFIGDVRDRDRLKRAMQGVHIVVHAAALKQVAACEYNPIEAVMTNVMGAKNVIDAALDSDVDRVMAISTDKAVNPVSVYGATKLCMEKLFIQGNAYSTSTGTRFSCVRYGNVIGSRGSLVTMLSEQRRPGRISLTDPRMTRFWISLDRATRFVARCIETMQGGEVFIPKLPSMKVVELARAAAPDCEIEFTGIRPGEKVHEVLLGEDEARNAREFDDIYMLLPAVLAHERPLPTGKELPEGFRYSSDRNDQWLGPDDLVRLMESDGHPET